MSEPGAGKPAQVPEGNLLRQLDRLRDAMPCNIELDQWLGGGMSGTQVAVIARFGSGYNDKVAVKLARIGEINNWLWAQKDCPPEFRDKHLASIETYEPSVSGESDWYIVTLKIAGGDLSLIRPSVEMESLRGKSFATACATIVKSVIADWNPAPLQHQLESVPPAAYLNSIFDASRVTPGKPLRDWLDSLDISPSDPLVRRPGWQEALPNPLALSSALDTGLCPGSRHLRVLYGRAHGDLHLRNVLMQIRPPRPREYKLIDLGGYNSKSQLARDPMHLLLSIAVEWLNSGIVPGREVSHSLINVIIRPRDQSPEKEYQEVSRSIHEAGHSWAASSAAASNLGDEWTRQSLLSLVGCGLLYASRQIPGVTDPAATRGWFFDLAAVAARTYLQDAGLWDRYVQESSTPPVRSGLEGIAALRPVPRDAGPDTQAPGPARQPSGPEAQESADAQILPLRRPAARSYRDAISGAGPPAAHQQGEWRELVGALRQVTFDSSDWRLLAARTDTLLRQLRQVHPLHPSAGEDIDRNMQLLDQTLTEVLTPSASSSEIRSACTRANILRNWLLDLLAEPGR